MKKFMIMLSAFLMMAAQVPAFAEGTDHGMLTANPKAEFMTELPPVYTKNVELGSSWSRNWFASAGFGPSTFVGSPCGSKEFFSGIRPAIQVSAGKWFTPSIGMRLGFQGWKFVDATGDQNCYKHGHADLLWNVIGLKYKDDMGYQRWTLSPFVGVGLMHHETSGVVPFSIDFGVLSTYRISQRLAVNMELNGITTMQDFDGDGNFQRFGDNLYSVSVGLTVIIGKTDWKRTVDARKYQQQNEYLKDYINELISHRDDVKAADNVNLAHETYAEDDNGE